MDCSLFVSRDARTSADPRTDILTLPARSVHADRCKRVPLEPGGHSCYFLGHHSQVNSAVSKRLRQRRRSFATIAANTGETDRPVNGGENCTWNYHSPTLPLYLHATPDQDAYTISSALPAQTILCQIVSTTFYNTDKSRRTTRATAHSIFTFVIHNGG